MPRYRWLFRFDLKDIDRIIVVYDSRHSSYPSIRHYIDFLKSLSEFGISVKLYDVADERYIEEIREVISALKYISRKCRVSSKPRGFSAERVAYVDEFGKPYVPYGILVVVFYEGCRKAVFYPHYVREDRYRYVYCSVDELIHQLRKLVERSLAVRG